MEKEMTVRELAVLGGRSGRGACKQRTEQMKAYWAKVRAGEIQHRGRGPTKPKQAEFPLENKGGANG